MKAALFTLLIASLTGFALLGCDDEKEKEAPERVLTLSIDAPAYFEPRLCTWIDSVEVTISARDQFDGGFPELTVHLSVGHVSEGPYPVFVDTVVEGRTSDDGMIRFQAPLRMYGHGDSIQFLAWTDSDTVVSYMKTGEVNEGALSLSLVCSPDTVHRADLPAAILVQSHFWYDFGWPAGEEFYLHASDGVIADSIQFLNNRSMFTSWYLPYFSSPGRHYIIADYSNVCLQPTDTTWVTIVQ